MLYLWSYGKKGNVMRFEWDNTKNKSNMEKHGIAFEEAIAAFNDRSAIHLFNRDANGEIRQHVIGKINELIVALVVYTNRNGNIRLISARRANKKEREQYHAK
jgi:uncharacterized protein